jgi:hypothetical protein
MEGWKKYSPPVVVTKWRTEMKFMGHLGEGRLKGLSVVWAMIGP